MYLYTPYVCLLWIPELCLQVCRPRHLTAVQTQANPGDVANALHDAKVIGMCAHSVDLHPPCKQNLHILHVNTLSKPSMDQVQSDLGQSPCITQPLEDQRVSPASTCANFYVIIRSCYSYCASMTCCWPDQKLGSSCAWLLAIDIGSLLQLFYLCSSVYLGMQEPLSSHFHHKQC